VRRKPAKADLLAALDRFGLHTASYVLLEGAKRYLTQPGIEGFVAWETRLGIPIVAGDPVSAPEAAASLLRGVRRQHWPRPVFAYAVSARMLPAFHEAGFRAVPVGAEPVFNPSLFSLAGGTRATLRAAVNHASKASLHAIEHHPSGPGAEPVNEELEAISSEWLEGKGAGELSFLLGAPQLSAPGRKRCFVARSERRVEGFLVCEPIPAGNGWYLDVTRRRSDATRGTMELLTTTALRTFGAEGGTRASMGLAPLAHLELGEAIACDSSRLLALFRTAFEVLVSPYDFANLARYKAKYAPDSLEPAFFCFAGAGAEGLTAWIVSRAIAAAKRQAERGAPQASQ
jgi:phosphatidylglycerol lysyltransferase